MTDKIKDEEDGLWKVAGDEEFFMYYEGTFMDSYFKLEPADEYKLVYEGETLMIPYEFL